MKIKISGNKMIESANSVIHSVLDRNPGCCSPDRTWVRYSVIEEMMRIYASQLLKGLKTKNEALRD